VFSWFLSRLKIRYATQKDYRHIERLLDNNWAVQARLFRDDIREKLTELITVIAEDRTAMRGLLMVEPIPPFLGLITVVAFHDNTNLTTTLDAMIPAVEDKLKENQIHCLTQVGGDMWFAQELPKHGFTVRERIVIFEWHGLSLPYLRPHPCLHIRSAHIDDLPQLQVLDQLTFSPMWYKPKTTLREALGKAAFFSVGVVEDKIVAYQWSDVYSEQGHITRLATHPDYRGQGIGAIMLHDAMRSLLDLNIKIVGLNTQESNTDSQRLYQKFGFQQVGEPIGVYEKAIINATFSEL